MTTMGDMFYGAKAFMQPLRTWNTPNVTSMTAMFNLATSFNRDLSMWDTSKCQNDMKDMLKDAPIANWKKAKGAKTGLRGLFS